jgi:hypothetical protein
MSPYEKRIADAFGLDEDGWARHANPWSGWTRYLTAGPALILAIWSRVWIGWWALAAIGLAILWIFLNPRFFPPARDDRAWMSRGVLGERLWTERDKRRMPPGFGWWTHLGNAVGALGLPALAYGLWVLDIWFTLAGFAVAVAGKTWFVHRMSHLYDAMVARDPSLRYRPPR